jgi:hypothetical protein
MKRHRQDRERELERLMGKNYPAFLAEYRRAAGLPEVSPVDDDMPSQLIQAIIGARLAVLRGKRRAGDAGPPE